jgi:hypothetical protein
MDDGGMVDGGAMLESLTAADLQISKGGTGRIAATGHYSDGSEAPVEAGLSFESFDTAVATVSAEGVVSGVAPGSTTVRASMSGVHVNVAVIVLDAFAILRDASDFWAIPGGNFGVDSQPGGAIVTSDVSDPVYEGAMSLSAAFAGGQVYAGFYLGFAEAQDLSRFEGGSLVLRIAEASSLVDAGVKIEWTGGSFQAQLANYTPTSDESGFLTYRIPLADFTGIDLAQITFPFGFWNPMMASPATDAGPGTPIAFGGTVYIDDVYFVAPAP